MKLRDYLKQFEGLDPEIEVYKREGFEDDPPRNDFGKSFEVLKVETDEELITKTKAILV